MISGWLKNSSDATWTKIISLEYQNYFLLNQSSFLYYQLDQNDHIILKMSNNKSQEKHKLQKCNGQNSSLRSHSKNISKLPNDIKQILNKNLFANIDSIRNKFGDLDKIMEINIAILYVAEGLSLSIKNCFYLPQ